MTSLPVVTIVTPIMPVVYLEANTSAGLVPSSIHWLSSKVRVTSAASFRTPMMISTHSMMISTAPME